MRGPVERSLGIDFRQLGIESLQLGTDPEFLAFPRGQVNSARVQTAVENLLAMGGLYEQRTEVLRPESLDELRAGFERARLTGQSVTLIGARRSFGEHFLPSTNGIGLDATQLGTDARALESEADGSLWVDVPGSFSFERLCRTFPGYLPFHPPTGDRVSLAGALAACSHDATAYFADDVREFELMTPDGQLHVCRADSSGIARELFQCVPGSFGALGVVLRMQLRLRCANARERAEINVLAKDPGVSYRALERLERIYQTKEYALGRGLFVYGRGRCTVLLGDRLMVPTPGESAPLLPLTDDATGRNIVLQGIANCIPGPVHRVLPWVFKKERRFFASSYGFLFYQRSYDRAYDFLSRDQLGLRLLRRVGVDPRLTVCHQSFLVAPEQIEKFVRLYFKTFDEFADIESRLEQQDLIRLGPCRHVLHPAYGHRDGVYIWSSSFSARRDKPYYSRIRAFLDEVSRRAYEQTASKVLLLKQAHCESDLLRRMHEPFISKLLTLKRTVDPQNLLSSRLLEFVTQASPSLRVNPPVATGNTASP